jgi:glycosyltransferase involved in cell wall biosynthesis
MLRALALSTIFPSDEAPYVGNFIERQLLGLAARPDVKLTVAAATFDKAVREARVSRTEWHGLDVFRVIVPGRETPGEAVPAAIAAAILPLATELRDSEGLDVLAAELLWPDGPAIAAVAEALRLPFSIKARGQEFAEIFAPWPRLLAQSLAAARRAGRLLAVSAGLRDRMIAAGIPAEKIAVHLTGVDLEQFRPRDRAALKAQLGVPGPLLLSAGNLTPAKGHGYAIEALALLPGATLFIAGGGDGAAALEQRAAELGVAARVRLVGHVPHLMLPRLMAAADVTVLATSREGLANVWVESLASGTPVVTTDVDGAREALCSPAAGRIVARDPQAIAAAVRELLAAPPPPDAVRACAERFTWDANAQALDRHLCELAAGAGPA